MPPALIGVPGTPVYSASSVVTPTTLTPDTGTGYAVGDVILCFTASRILAPTVATPAGWTQILNVTGSTLFRLVIFARVAASTSEAAPSVVWSGLTAGSSGDPVAAMCQAVTGVETNLAAIVDVIGAVVQGGNSTTVVQGGGAITTTATNDLVLVLGVRSDDVANTWSASGYTNVTGGAGAGASMFTDSGLDMAAQWAYLVKATAGSVGATFFTISGGTIASSPSAGVQIALKAATAPTTPQNTVAPAVTGSRVVGATLTGTDGTWTNTPTDYDYQWLLDSVPISGETAATYEIQVGDVAHLLQLQVTASNGVGAGPPALSNEVRALAVIVGTDLKFFTAAAGGIGGSPGVVVPTATFTWDAVSAAEATDGDVEYRAGYVKNIHEETPVEDVALWIATQTSSPTTSVAIGLAPEAVGSDVTPIANESLPPIGVTFTQPATQGAGLAIGTLEPGETKGYWVAWTVLAGTADAAEDTYTLGVFGNPA